MVSKFYWLDDIQSADRPWVGDKAFHLSQLLQQGYPVVPGFVVPSQLAHEFLGLLGESEPLLADLPHSSLHLDVDNPRQLQQVAQRLRNCVMSAKLPASWLSMLDSAIHLEEAPALILRPSLAIPWKSKYRISELWETHIACVSQQSLEISLKRVWANLFRARSLFYYQRVGIELEEIKLAVLVQPLSNAIASGTLYASDTDNWEIHATWGLANALYKGEVIPDSYQCSRHSGAVLSRKMGAKTRAYRLSVPAALDESCLEAYLLDDEEQKEYALEEKYIEELIELAQQLRSTQREAFALEWMLSVETATSSPQLQIAQVEADSLLMSHGSYPLRRAKFMPYITSNTLEKQLPFNKTEGLRPTSLEKDVGEMTVDQILVRGIPAASGRAIAPTQVLNDSIQHLDAVIPGSILVVHAVQPAWIPLLKQASGVVTELGGMTCHAAIIARELGIPAVVGAAGATQLIQTGDFVLLDGERGEVHRVTSHRFREVSPIATDSPSLIATGLMVNLSQVSSIDRIAGMPVDGIGLLRSELMLMEVLENQHPSSWLQQGRQAELMQILTTKIAIFAAAFAPRPLFYRSLDLRSHEFGSLTASSDLESEANPMLGVRGTFSYLVDPTLFDLELAALAQVCERYSNVNLILPFVRTVEEFIFCRRHVEQAGLLQHPSFQLWIMAEVPSVLFLISDYVNAGVQGISIGTNDLTQLILGIDRDLEHLGTSLDARHPAISRAIAQIIKLAKDSGIPCCICGQAPVLYPELVDRLVGWGITSISVEPNAIEQTYSAIARAEQRLLLEAARRQLATD
ncbi:MAG: phosphoenolpyruvate synthase [Chamaesiphon sp.]